MSKRSISAGERSPSSPRSPNLEDKQKKPLSSYMSGINASEKDELYHSNITNEENKPWWSTNLHLSEPILFGAWDGVFTSCILNTFGVVIFLRSGWVVGNAGILLALLMIFMTLLPVYICVGAAIGICQRTFMREGGVYSLLAFVLGYRTASSIAFIYCIGQACSCSLFVSGLAESIASLADLKNPWITKGIAVAFLILLLSVNLAGIHWVIRLQVLLLIVVTVAVGSFIVGSFLPHDPETGIVGYSSENMKKNLDPDFLPEESFISVLGVIFPTVCGIFTGLNMSGQLKDPRENVPLGTIFAVVAVTILYTLFILIFGAVAERETLKMDYNIASKVSAWSPLLLAGLYVSALSAALGGITSSPRLLHAIAVTTKLPALSIFSKTMGENQIPIAALIMLITVSIFSALFGDVNILGPIVTIPFLITYASIGYSYFLLAITYDNKHRRAEAQNKIFREDNDDLENLFPERKVARDFEINESIPKIFKNKQSVEEHKMIREKPKKWYSFLINRWMSLFAAFYCIGIIFLLEWSYAILVFAIMFGVYIIAGTGEDGLAAGVAGELSLLHEFSIAMQEYYAVFLNTCFCCYSKKIADYESLKGDSIKNKLDAREQFISQENIKDIPMMSDQINETGEDYADRDNYHQSKNITVNPPVR